MKAIALRLADEQLEEIEDLAGAGYGPEKIAMYLDVPRKDFMKDWNTPDTFIRYHYDRGILSTDASIGIALANNARTGNITAAQQLAKIRYEQYLQDCKTQIYFSHDLD